VVSISVAPPSKGTRSSKMTNTDAFLFSSFPPKPMSAFVVGVWQEVADERGHPSRKTGYSMCTDMSRCVGGLEGWYLS
jgi:hypothetical protein